MPTNRRYLLAKRPEGRPDRDTFDLVEEPVPEPDPGEVLVRTLYLSVDPYMRDRMAPGRSYADPWDVGDPLRGTVVGQVVESRTDRWNEGDLVTGELEWAEYTVTEETDLFAVDPRIEPLSAHLGVLGMPGRTAYFGMLDVADPDPGDTVVVSGAAGAVGSVAGQLADMAGGSVVGFAGTDEKVAFLEDELGFDAAINYETTDEYREALDREAPGGVDIYFDNVGGPITDAVFTRLATDARVAVCGQIALYNAEEVPHGPRKLPALISSRATVQGFLVRDFSPRFTEATERLGEWYQEGALTYRETVTEGIERAPEAFLGLFEGENIGKQVVKVAEPEG
ncbi:MAG: NADP-dependent oxidoreductase [Halodesulfurarchaeum sp.]